MDDLIKYLIQVAEKINCPDLILSHQIAGNRYNLVVQENQLFKIGALWAQLTEVLIEQGMINSAIDIYQIQMEKSWLIHFQDKWLCFSEESVINCNLPDIPSLKKPLIIALGGCSGSGKTTIGKKISKKLHGEVLMYLAYTSRPPRKGEIDGIDYHFIDGQELNSYRSNPYYCEFVKARDNWYWVNRYQILSSVINNPDKIHMFFITQRHEFLIKSKFFPWMDWIWLDAPENQIKHRLEERGDKNIEDSLAHNSKILSVHINDLISFRIDNLDNQFDKTVEQIINFLNMRRKQ